MSSDRAALPNVRIKTEPEDIFENDDWERPADSPTEPVPVNLIKKNRKGAVLLPCDFWKATGNVSYDAPSQDKTESKKRNTSAAASGEGTYQYPARSGKDPEDDPPVKAPLKRKLDAESSNVKTDIIAAAEVLNTGAYTQLLQTKQTVSISPKNVVFNLKGLFASGQNRVIVLKSPQPLDNDTLVKASLQAVQKCNNSQINASGNATESPAAKKTKFYNVLNRQQAVELTDNYSVLRKSSEVRPTFMFDDKIKKLIEPTLSKEMTVTLHTPPVQQGQASRDPTVDSGPSNVRRKSKPNCEESAQNKVLLTIPPDIDPDFTPFKIQSTTAQYGTEAVIHKQKFSAILPNTVPTIQTPDVPTSTGTEKNERLIVVKKFSDTASMSSIPSKTLQADATTKSDQITETSDKVKEPLDLDVMKNEKPKDTTIAKLKEKIHNSIGKTVTRTEEKSCKTILTSTYSDLNNQIESVVNDCKIVHSNVDKSGSVTVTESCSSLPCSVSPMRKVPDQTINNNRCCNVEKPMKSILSSTKDNVETTNISKQHLNASKNNPESSNSVEKSSNKSETSIENIKSNLLDFCKAHIEEKSKMTKDEFSRRASFSFKSQVSHGKVDKSNLKQDNEKMRNSSVTENVGTNPKNLDKELREDLTHVPKSTCGAGKYLNAVASYINKFTSNQDTMTDKDGSEIERTVILTTKVKKRQLMYSSIIESNFIRKECLCSISKAVVPDEQTYFMYGTLRYLPNVGILLCGEHEVTGLKLDGDWYLCLPEIINKIPELLSTNLQNYVHLNNASTRLIPVEFRWYMRKRQGIPVTTGNLLLSLSSFQTFLGSLSNLDACSKDRSESLSKISSFHSGMVYKKVFGRKLRCISCQGLIPIKENTAYFTDIDADDSVLGTTQLLEDSVEKESSYVGGDLKQQDENDEMDNEANSTESRKKTETRIMMKLGMVDIAGELFHAFKLEHRTFLSLNQLYVRNVVMIKRVLTLLAKMNIIPRRPPSAVENFLHGIYSTFVNTGWIEITVLEYVCKQESMKFRKRRKDIFDAISRGQYKENFMSSIYSEDDTKCDVLDLNLRSGRIITWKRGCSKETTSQMPETQKLLKDVQIGAHHGVVKLADNSVEFLGEAHLRKDRNTHKLSSHIVSPVPISRKRESDVQKGVHCDEVKQDDNSDQFLGQDELERDGNALRNFKPLSDILPITYNKKTVNSSGKKKFKRTPSEDRSTKKSTGTDSTMSDLYSFSERKGRKRKCTQNLKYCDSDKEVYSSQKGEISITSCNVDKSDLGESRMVISSTQNDETTVEFIIETECVGDSTALFGMRSANNESYNESESDHTISKRLTKVNKTKRGSHDISSVTRMKENDKEKDKEESGSHEILTQEQSHSAEYYPIFVKSEPYDPNWDNLDNDNIASMVSKGSPYPLFNEIRNENGDTTNQMDTSEATKYCVNKEVGLPPTHLPSDFVHLDKVKEEIDIS